MFRNYFKIAFRNLIHHKNLSITNIIGLAIGVAAFILIFVYIQYELSFNKFNKNYNRIHRVETEHILINGNEKSDDTPFPLAPNLVNNFPEILNAVRLMPLGKKSLSASRDRRFLEKDGIYADNSLFDLFSFNFIDGHPNSALKEPFKIVLTKSLTEKYFPDGETIGKILRYDNKFDCKVTGVIEDPLPNSDIKFTYILSFPSRKTIVGWDYSNDWDSHHVHTYVLLPQDYSYKEMTKKICITVNNFGHTHPRNLYLKPLSKKTREIGIRKVLGASVPDVLRLLTIEFIRCVLFANLIAWPIVWYAATQWLENFAYRINIIVWPFLLAGMGALVIALLTVSWQAIRAAMANPVDSLRYE